MRNVHIINLSDCPANITKDELDFSLDNISSFCNPIVHYDSFSNREKGIDTFNTLMESDNDIDILFTSGGIQSILTVSDLTKKVGKGKKRLFGFSDLLHIQQSYITFPSVELYYGSSMRSISKIDFKEVLEGDKTLEFVGGNLEIFTYFSIEEKELVKDYLKIKPLFLESHGIQDDICEYNILRLLSSGIINSDTVIYTYESSNLIPLFLKYNIVYVDISCSNYIKLY